MSASLKSTVLHSFKWLAVARLSAQVIRWIVTFLVIRVLTPADYGIVALAEPVIGFMEIFATMGLGSAIIRSQEISKSQLKSIFSFILIINSSLFIILILSAPAISTFYSQPDLVLVLRVLALGFLFSALEVIPSTLLAKELKFKKLALIQLFAGIIGAITSLMLAYNGFGYWTIVLGGMSIQLARLLAVLSVKPIMLFPSTQLKLAWQFVSFGGYVLGSNVIWYLYVTVDLVIAGRYWSAEQLGIYAVSLQLASMPLNKIMPPMKQIALPAYSKTQSDLQAGRYYFLKSLRLGMGISFPIFFGLASISTILVPTLLDVKWEDISSPLTILFLAMPFRIFLELHQPAVTARGKPQLLLWNSLIILNFMLPAFFIAINYNPAILASVWLSVFPILVIYSSYRYCKFLGVNFPVLIKSIIPGLFVSILMFIFIRGIIQLFHLDLFSVVNLVLVIFIGAIFYLIAILFVDRNLFKEYFSLFR